MLNPRPVNASGMDIANAITPHAVKMPKNQKPVLSSNRTWLLNPVRNAMSRLTAR